MSIGRIIVACSSLTNSHLSSSFIAFYGRSNLRRISVIVKQVIINFKNQDEKQEGAFCEEKLFFSIIFQSIMKVLCKGTPENISDMKELVKKIVLFMNFDGTKKKISERLMVFITEIIDFSFTDSRNFCMLESLVFFISKNSLPEGKIREIYDHIKYYDDNLQSGNLSIAGILSHLKKLLGITVVEEENFLESKNESQNTVDQSFQRPKLYKAAKPSGLRERLPRLTKTPGASSEKNSKKRNSRDSYLNENEGIEEPLGKTRKAALKRKTEKT